jgi:hypothetical protein
VAKGALTTNHRQDVIGVAISRVGALKGELSGAIDDLAAAGTDEAPGIPSRGDFRVVGTSQLDERHGPLELLLLMGREAALVLQARQRGHGRAIQRGGSCFWEFSPQGECVDLPCILGLQGL